MKTAVKTIAELVKGDDVAVIRGDRSQDVHLMKVTRVTGSHVLVGFELFNRRTGFKMGPDGQYTSCRIEVQNEEHAVAYAKGRHIVALSAIRPCDLELLSLESLRQIRGIYIAAREAAK